MKLSDGEKLILVMLAEVSKRLGIKGSIDPDFVLEAIYSGNLWGLGWEYGGILGTEVDDAVVKETVNILDMWSAIEHSYQALSEEEREIVDGDSDGWAKFRGFDGNNESEHLGVARFLVEQLDRFSSFKSRDLNSHMPSLDRYRVMLRLFDPMRPKLDPNLSTGQIVELFSVR